MTSEPEKAENGIRTDRNLNPVLCGVVMSFAALLFATIVLFALVQFELVVGEGAEGAGLYWVYSFPATIFAAFLLSRFLRAQYVGANTSAYAVTIFAFGAAASAIVGSATTYLVLVVLVT